MNNKRVSARKTPAEIDKPMRDGPLRIIDTDTIAVDVKIRFEAPASTSCYAAGYSWIFNQRAAVIIIEIRRARARIVINPSVMRGNAYLHF